MYPNPNPTAPHPALPVPELVDSQTRSANAFDALKLATARHAKAVAAAKATGHGLLDPLTDAMVNEVLVAGTALESALRKALDCGYSPEKLSEVSGMHPLYLEMLFADPR